MRTRCPACRTVFRVTAEQLRLKSGKVRCGYCHAVFNALDELIDDSAARDGVSPAVDRIPLMPEGCAAVDATERVDTQFPEAVEDDAGIAVTHGEIPEAHVVPGADTALCDAGIKASSDGDEVERARAAGLVVARELSETPGYNRWADGVLSTGPGGFEGGEERSRWPYLLAVVLLFVILFAQAAFVWRVDVVRRIPDAAMVYELLGIDVPLLRDVELISIESSDLQSEPARGFFVLNAQLRNRAPFAQEWPLLELTLTDTADTVIARRVLAAKDYLPPGADLSAFPPGSEAPVRIWLDAKGLGAGGYRLFVFYP